ncbi:MAG: hypothetical protein ACE5RH_00960, partial [Nitrosarchaeum sp.]
VKFRFVAASASTTNDGSMPYGSTVKSVISTIKDDYGIDATTSLVSSSALSGNNVTVFLNHSSNVSDGKYTLTSKVSFSLYGSTLIFTREYDFRRIYLRNE